MQKIPTFYRDKPIIGVDIGQHTIKIVRIDVGKKDYHDVRGYGSADFTKPIIQSDMIIDPAATGNDIRNLLNQTLGSDTIGDRRVVGSLPTRYAYIRSLYFPKLKSKELRDAINLELEQSVPIPVADLVVSYDVFDAKPHKDKDGHEVPVSADQAIEVVVTAAPRKLIDSFCQAFVEAGLELAAIETSIQSLNRLIGFADDKSSTTLLVDIGDNSVDMCVVDSVIRVVTMVDGGGRSFTQQIAKHYDVPQKVAEGLKFKYGLGVGKYQAGMREALTPPLSVLIKEIQKIMRFYEERSGPQGGVQQIITTGGGANMPGLSDYLIDTLRLPVRMCNVWQNMNFSSIEKPKIYDDSTYATAAGLALLDIREIYS